MAEFSPAFNLPDLKTAVTMTFVNSFPWGIFVPPPVTPVNVQVTVQQATFVLRGFFAGSGQYEVWTGPSRNTPPPSGHTLTDITVIAELVGTGTF